METVSQQPIIIPELTVRVVTTNPQKMQLRKQEYTVTSPPVFGGGGCIESGWSRNYESFIGYNNNMYEW